VIQLNLRDITQRRRFEQQLQQTAKLESLGILAGGIAHDFNNLLAGIMGNASLALLDAKGSPRYQSGLRDVVRASQRAAELTSQMLAYAGKGRYVVRQADMSEMVRDISALVLTSIPKTVRVELNLASGLPAVEADVSQLQQVIMNLIINGAESIAEGRSGFVRIITAADDFNPARHHIRIAAEGIQPGRFVVLEVSDSGSGMSEAVLARIFDPFFTTKFTGRGLGLAAVQGIVRGHGGALTVHSEPGKGTTFRVFIPASTRGKAVPEKQPDPDELRGEGTILVVDDEADVATMAQAVLESHGYKTVTAGNGEIAIRILRERGAEISAVILDLTMPVMGGEEAVGPIRELYPSLPVILSTGYDSSEVGDRIRAESISGVLQKPYTAQGLLQLVKEAILRK
jgi:nitrogen-specific signal transduction histidine kinase/CheY-like chemotaxis protein